jgi:hypothetical protein
MTRRPPITLRDAPSTRVGAVSQDSVSTYALVFVAVVGVLVVVMVGS